ncbi:MAG TPA: NDMA-dependent alcohol dehydrogenase [Ilumatobacter sp.]|nr:NDMA-dependent alcohol dehydrogenase [Ilumatobacter sp.]
MKTRAAVLWGQHQEWKIEDVELGEPGPTEVIVKMAFAGLCHSDEHLVTGDITAPAEILALVGAPHFLPCIGGHEGAGVVEQVGDAVRGVAVGDHVSVSFIPSCGLCKWCSTGRQNLCDMGAATLAGGMIADGQYKHHAKDTPLNRMAQLGTFSEYILVNQASVIKVDDDYPLDVVALVSCGVATGVGSAQKRAEVKSGDTVVVVGIGGIGANAVQGARLNGAANIIAIDTNVDKKEKAEEFGATHFFTSFQEAAGAVMEMTRGNMADSCIITAGVVTGDLIDPALSIIAKDGTVVVTGLAPMSQRDVKLDLFGLAMYNKQIRGSIFGSSNPRAEIPRLLQEYRRGALKLSELITNRYKLEEINQGYQDMNDGKNIRGVIEFG